MLRNDLKQQLPEGWETQFKHHELYPENYYDVAEFEINGKNKILVLNRNTMDLMEYYYDDIPDDQWIDLEKFFINKNINIPKGTYKINKRYQKLTISTGKIANFSNHTCSRSQYPMISFNLISKNTGKTKPVHLVVAHMFIPNPDPESRVVVNHKDNNKLNFNKENLEWVTISYNNLHSNSLSPERIRYEYRLMSRDKKTIIKTWNGYKELESDGSIVNYRRYLNKDILVNGKYYLISVDLTLDDYKSRHPVIEDGWYTNPFITTHKVEANLCGVLRINGKETVGSLNKNSLCYIVTITKDGIKVNYMVHRLVYETITGKKIDEGKVIDHIQPVRSVETINNEFSNLREATFSENNNNPETLKLISNPCKCYDLSGNFIKSYESISKTKSEIPNLVSNIKSVLDGRKLFARNFLWCYIGDENKINEDTKHIYYRFNSAGNIITASCTLIGLLLEDELSKGLTESAKYWIINRDYRKYLNTGMPAPDGYYYQQGYPDEFLCDPDNKDLVKKREEIKWKPKDKR